ncbi:MAG TPA: hypothetical protein VK642_01875 [Burkholderiales bacterium]|nr:hypothetical protein [Burkholderiales bacterium]
MLAWFKRGKVDHPLANPDVAKTIADALSLRDPCKALEEASQWLSSINEAAGFKLQRRFELIDLLDAATRTAQERLVDMYVILPQGDRQEKRIWQAANDFWKLLGDGYLACARQSSDTVSVPEGLKAQLPLLATRGLRALRNQMKWTLIHYGMLRTELWGECGRFAMLAESAGGAAQQIELFAGSNIQSSPSHELLRVVMFWAVMPGGLSPAEQDIAERLVVYLTLKFRSSTQVEDEYDYFFDLDGSRPPLRFVRGAPASASMRYFDVGEGRDVLHTMYVTVSRSGNLPVSVNWGSAAETNVVVRVLKHLWVNWAKALPPRAAARQKSDTRLNAVQGYQNVLGLVAPQSAHGLAAASALLSDSWIAEDMSSGGCGVIVPHGDGEGLRVGVLVALREPTNASWKVGIVRRVSGHNYRQHHVGIQLISGAAAPAS